MMYGSSHSFSVGRFSRKTRFKPFLLSYPVEPVVGFPRRSRQTNLTGEMRVSPELPISCSSRAQAQNCRWCIPMDDLGSKVELIANVIADDSAQPRELLTLE